MGFTLILQHSASKQEWLIEDLADNGNTLAYVFKGFEMPYDAPDGEYYACLVWNGRDDVEWELKDVPLDSIAHTSVGDVILRDLRPEVFLMRYGIPEKQAQYQDTDKQYYYYKR